MAFIEWGEEFSVHNEAIDSQHRTLIGIVNTLHEAMTRGEDPAVLDSSLAELVDYTHFHFRAEEEALARGDSGLLETQKREHDRMTRQVAALNEKYAQGSATLLFEILDLLHDWLINHVKGLDRRSFSS